MSSSAATETRNALIAALVCYTAWGVFPLLFMAMAHSGFTAPEILTQRAVWALLFAAALVLATGRIAQVRSVLATPATMGWLLLSTVMILINWGAYVWATTQHHTLEASLGYYINPLLNMVAGLFLFRERIDKWGWIAIGSAAVGVVLQTLALGRAPWLSILIAVSFAAYGVIRPGRSPAVWRRFCRWPCSPGRRGGCPCRRSASCSFWLPRCSSPSGWLRASP
jgi:chloramphenicol-sensitive protein RarD